MDDESYFMYNAYLFLNKFKMANCERETG